MRKSTACLCLAIPLIHCLHYTAWQHEHVASCLATFIWAAKQQLQQHAQTRLLTATNTHPRQQLLLQTKTVITVVVVAAAVFAYRTWSTNIDKLRMTVLRSFTRGAHSFACSVGNQLLLLSVAKWASCACVPYAFFVRFKTRVFQKQKTAENIWPIVFRSWWQIDVPCVCMC